jgi:hypothetical protein
VEVGCLCSKYAYSAEWKKHMYLSKENHLHYKLQHQGQCFPVKIELVFKGILPATLIFLDGDKLFLIQQPFSAEMMKHTYLAKENHLC